MNDKLTLDRETFKVLAADTRIDILKNLAAHKLTLTDLSHQMDMSPSTIKEHLDRLVEVGLIEQVDKGMKWKYYRLTAKGSNIVSPYETKVWILLGSTALVLAASAVSLYSKLKSISLSGAPGVIVKERFLSHAGRSGDLVKASEALNDTVSHREFLVSEATRSAAAKADAMLTQASADFSGHTTTTLVERVVDYLPAEPASLDVMSLPVLELSVIGLCLVVFGFCMGQIMKKRINIK